VKSRGRLLAEASFWRSQIKRPAMKAAPYQPSLAM
jgi:hypothetical protein